MKINTKRSELFTPKCNVTRPYPKRLAKIYEWLRSDSCHLLKRSTFKRGKRWPKPSGLPKVELEKAAQPGAHPAPDVTTPPAPPRLRLTAPVGRGGGGGRGARKCGWRVPAALGIVGDSANGVGESGGLGELALKLFARLAGDELCGQTPRQREGPARLVGSSARAGGA